MLRYFKILCNTIVSYVCKMTEVCDEFGDSGGQYWKLSKSIADILSSLILFIELPTA